MSPFRLHRHFPVKPLGADGYQEFCAGTIPVKRVLTLEGRSPIVAVEQSTGVPARLRQAPRRRVSARRSALERRLSGDLAGHYRRPRRTVAGAPRARHRRSTAPGPSAVQAGHAAALVVSRRRRLLRAAAQGTQKIGRRAVYPILGARPDTSPARPAAHPALPRDPDAGSRAARADTRALAIAVTRHVGSGALKDTPVPCRNPSFSGRYIAISSQGAPCPIEAGILGRLADHECRHGRLSGDRTPPCGCWTQEPNYVRPPGETRVPATRNGDLNPTPYVVTSG